MIWKWSHQAKDLSKLNAPSEALIGRHCCLPRLKSLSSASRFIPKNACNSLWQNKYNLLASHVLGEWKGRQGPARFVSIEKAADLPDLLPALVTHENSCKKTKRCLKYLYWNALNIRLSSEVCRSYVQKSRCATARVSHPQETPVQVPGSHYGNWTHHRAVQQQTPRPSLHSFSLDNRSSSTFCRLGSKSAWYSEITRTTYMDRLVVQLWLQLRRAHELG